MGTNSNNQSSGSNQRNTHGHGKIKVMSEINSKNIESHQSNTKHHSVIMTGMVKDSDNIVIGTLNEMSEFICNLAEADHEMLIYESGSRAGSKTPANLRGWARDAPLCPFTKSKDFDKLDKDENIQSKSVESPVPSPESTHKHVIHVSHEEDPATPDMTRTDRFVLYRNQQLDLVAELVKEKGMEIDDLLLIIADYDIHGIKIDRILEEFNAVDQSTNVLCAFGQEVTRRYRDTWATVFDDGWWCYEDFHKCHNRLQQKRFTEVHSCFGGMAIYRYRDIAASGCRYTPKSELQSKAPGTYEWFDGYDPEKVGKSEICEHIAFHDCLRERIPGFSMVVSRDSHLFYGGNWMHERPVQLVRD